MLPTLTAELAQAIAGETSTIIGFNVLITDREATVIGSGDVSRVGTVHEASIEVLETLRPATHSAEQAKRMRGVRPGITLPIVLDGTAVGTVGLTGSPQRVRQFGLVVQRQTEILLQESVVLRSRLLREQAREDLLRDVSVFDPDVMKPAAMIARGGELGLDLRLPRVAVLIAVGVLVQTDRGLSPSTVLPSTVSPLRAVRGAFHDPQDIVAEMTAGRFAVLHRVAGTGGWEASLESRCRDLVAHLAERHGVAAHVGFGGVATDLPGLHDSYVDASAAARIGPEVVAGAGVYPIETLRVHQLLDSTGHNAGTRFIESQLGDAPAGQAWPDLRATVLAWSEAGFNLVRAAQRLHIHRNTLLYRLDKISKRTGKDMRDPVEATGVYLACVIEQLRR
jgi:carbohydrate diacid regulator